jgi:hypothetical protein
MGREKETSEAAWAVISGGADFSKGAGSTSGTPINPVLALEGYEASMPGRISLVAYLRGRT